MKYIWTKIPSDVVAVIKEYNTAKRQVEILPLKEIPYWDGVKYAYDDCVHDECVLGNEVLTDFGSSLKCGDISFEISYIPSQHALECAWHRFHNTGKNTSVSFGYFLKEELGVVIENSLEMTNDNDVYEMVVNSIQDYV